jgi:orotidine-5'-phosphate decarboxylase
MSKNKNKLALALDNVTSLREIESLIEQTSDSIGVYKVGLEQFTRHGPEVLSAIKASKCKIFLDLKFHDIPNTVAKAVGSACDLGVDYLTIHTQGGIEMMKAAVEASRVSAGNTPSIIGVTLLTSIGSDILKDELRISLSTGEYVMHLASCAISAGLQGIVCSAADLPTVKSLLPRDFIVITPGIRPAGASIGDQKRVATPADAIKNGATLLVIGRPITGAKNPGDAARSILEEIATS